ncbi:hypothetical protein Tco_0309090 [Tanacetum coccineum]
MHPGKSQSKHIDEFHKLVDFAIWSGYFEARRRLATLNSRELQKMMEEKGNGGEGLYSEEHLKRDCPRYNHKKSQGFVRNKDQVSGYGADGYNSADVMIAISVEELLDWIMDSGGSYHITNKIDYLVYFEEYDGDNLLLGDDRECRVRGTGKVQVQMRVLP